jgi:ATP-binding cassette, subfamily B, heavy metal transporter
LILKFRLYLFTGARLFLRGSAIQIQDESTSAIDTVTEVELTEALNELGGNRTQIIVAHRLSTIVDSNMIVVMKNGRIIEQADHNSLLKLGGVYADMWNRQSREVVPVDV